MMNSAFIILFLAASVIAIETSSCKIISCSYTNASVGSSCVTVSESAVTLNPCPDGSYCSGLDQFWSSKEHYTATCTNNPVETTETCPTSNIGDVGTYMYCCTDADCASNKCDSISHKCVGIAWGGACKSNEACESGFYCSRGLCSPVRGAGKDCKYDYQCRAGYGCYSGMCLKYFSIKNGYPVDDNDESFCKSKTQGYGMCDTISIYSGGKMLSEPWKCTIGQTCSYKWTRAGRKYKEDEMCECAGKESTETRGYCPIRGIPAIDDFTSNFYEKFQYGSSDCSGNWTHLVELENDLSALVYCNSIDHDGKDYYDQISKIMSAWPLYSSGQIDGCAKDMGIFDPDEDVDSWDSAEFFILPGLLILFSSNL